MNNKSIYYIKKDGYYYYNKKYKYYDDIPFSSRFIICYNTEHLNIVFKSLCFDDTLYGLSLKIVINNL